MFENITAGRDTDNATLQLAHSIVQEIAATGKVANPRIYANKSGGNGEMIPETGTQDNSDLPGWTDITPGESLAGLGLPDDLPVYLSVWVAESMGGGNFLDVADIDRYVNQWRVMSLSQAIGVS